MGGIKVKSFAGVMECFLDPEKLRVEGVRVSVRSVLQ